LDKDVEIENTVKWLVPCQKAAPVRGNLMLTFKIMPLQSIGLSELAINVLPVPPMPDYR
jgi:hypothetical protein